ncbi:hypothetical protein GCM10010452_64310 [Crossiella cryophila]
MDAGEAGAARHRQFGARHREGFPDGHLYANLHGFDLDNTKIAPADVLERFLLALGLDTEHLSLGMFSPEEAIALLRKVIAGRDDRGTGSGGVARVGLGTPAGGVPAQPVPVPRPAARVRPSAGQGSAGLGTTARRAGDPGNS